MTPPAIVSAEAAANGMIRSIANQSPRCMGQPAGVARLQSQARRAAINAVKARVAAADTATVLQKLIRCFAMMSAWAK